MLVTPYFLFLGYEDGVAFYDLLTGDWCDLPLNQAVTSLAVFNQMLIDLKGRILLHSYNVQAEVTDLLIWRDIMLISTLQSGIKYKNEHKSVFQTIL